MYGNTSMWKASMISMAVPISKTKSNTPNMGLAHGFKDYVKGSEK